MIDDEFANIFVGNKARFFCQNAVEELITESAVKSIVPGRYGFMILFCQRLLRQLRDWINGSILY